MKFSAKKIKTKLWSLEFYHDKEKSSKLKMMKNKNWEFKQSVYYKCMTINKRLQGSKNKI